MSLYPPSSFALLGPLDTCTRNSSASRLLPPWVTAKAQRRNRRAVPPADQEIVSGLLIDFGSVSTTNGGARKPRRIWYQSAAVIGTLSPVPERRRGASRSPSVAQSLRLAAPNSSLSDDGGKGKKAPEPSILRRCRTRRVLSGRVTIERCQNLATQC